MSARVAIVTVNTVAPGQTVTDTFPGLHSETEIGRFAEAIPLRRLERPAPIANVVALLASPENHWVNGRVIRANGGLR